MQPCQQTIQRDEAGAAAEDAIEPGPQRETAGCDNEYGSYSVCC
jgi:hypothetical protein